MATLQAQIYGRTKDNAGGEAVMSTERNVPEDLNLQVKLQTKYISQGDYTAKTQVKSTLRLMKYYAMRTWESGVVAPGIHRLRI